VQLIPPWWIWYYWICPLAWTLYGLIASQFGDITSTVHVVATGETPTVKHYIDTSFGYKQSFLGVVAGVMVGWSVFFAIIFVFAIRYLNFQRR
jgi:hypothetical protein